MCTDATSSIPSSAHRMNAENKCTTIQPWRKFSTYQVSAIIILFKYNHSNKKKTLINVIISAHKIFINFIIILDMAEKKKFLKYDIFIYSLSNVNNILAEIFFKIIVFII